VDELHELQSHGHVNSFSAMDVDSDVATTKTKSSGGGGLSLIAKILAKIKTRRHRSKVIKNQLQRVEDNHKAEMKNLMDENKILQSRLAQANEINDPSMVNQINDEVTAVNHKQEELLINFNNERAGLEKSLDDEEEHEDLLRDELSKLQAATPPPPQSTTASTSSGVSFPLIPKMLAKIKSRRHRSKVIKNQLKRVEDNHSAEIKKLADENDDLLFRLAEANANNDELLARQINDQITTVALKQQNQLNNFEKDRAGLEKSLAEEDEHEEMLGEELVKLHESTPPPTGTAPPAHASVTPPPQQSLIQKLLAKMNMKKRRSNAIKKEMRKAESDQM